MESKKPNSQKQRSDMWLLEAEAGGMEELGEGGKKGTDFQ